MYEDTTIAGNLDVGSGSYSRIRSHAATSGYTGYSELNAASAWDMWINLETTYLNGGWMYFQIKHVNLMQFSGSTQTINYYKPLVNSSDGRLKENEVII